MGADSVDYMVTGAVTDGADASDFDGGILPNSTVLFADGETSQLITINVAGDTEVEASEDFLVTLFNPSRGGTLDPDAAAGTIVDDDSPTPDVWINVIPLRR